MRAALRGSCGIGNSNLNPGFLVASPVMIMCSVTFPPMLTETQIGGAHASLKRGSFSSLFHSDRPPGEGEKMRDTNFFAYECIKMCLSGYLCST